MRKSEREERALKRARERAAASFKLCAMVAIDLIDLLIAVFMAGREMGRGEKKKPPPTKRKRLTPR